MIAELGRSNLSTFCSKGFLRNLGKGEKEEWEKENSAFNEKWIHIAEYNGKTMSAVSRRILNTTIISVLGRDILGLRLLCLNLVVKGWILRRLGFRMHHWKFSVNYLSKL